jgi:hypothetical protein
LARARGKIKNMKYTVVSKPGRELTREEIAACVAVIDEGGALEDPETAKRELPHAIAVAIIHGGESVVGVGAIKQARPAYAAGIASDKKSGFSFDSQMSELGYVAILKAHRGGKSGLVVNSLLKRFEGPLWATTSEKLMTYSLTNRGFERKGNEWPSQTHPGKMLSLWIKSQPPIIRF